MNSFTNDSSRGSTIRVAAAQINPTVGDLTGNVNKICQWIARARQESVQILVFPELCLCGYPPKDLLLKTKFISDQRDALEEIIPETKGMFVLVGLVIREGDAYNAAAILHDGKLLGFARKVGLPNYRVFDEKRYFRAGEHLTAAQTDIANVGILICEDLWHPETTANMASTGVDLILCLSASPFSVGRPMDRRTLIACRCQDHNLGIVYCNQIGGQDELVFDGNSLIMNSRGHSLASGASFEEDLAVADIRFEEIHRNRLAAPLQRDSRISGMPGREGIHIIHSEGSTRPYSPPKQPRSNLDPYSSPISITYDPVADAYSALVLGLRDYVLKNGFREVVIGLSGGIDSALTAAIAAEALGSNCVIGVSMPSRYSSDHSVNDAVDLANNLGITYKQFAIEEIYQTYLTLFADEFRDHPFDITEENLQARIRGAILMALSNKFGWLVLATGNKSELSVGYSTLYGDMCGGLAVIGDAPKTLVYAMSEYCNRQAGRVLIPENTIHKPPSAELRENQLDSDSLPPYDALDEILYAYIEQDCSIPEIVELGYDADLVKRVVNLVDRAEYKRRQAAIVLRVTSKAFGSDRRLPVTNKYRSG